MKGRTVRRWNGDDRSGVRRFQLRHKRGRLDRQAFMTVTKLCM